MVGRQREMEAGRAFLDVVEGGPACVVFDGEAGIGKTTVWKETVALAERRGYRVLACRPAAAEAKLSYSGLADLLAGVDPGTLEQLPGPQRSALEVALLQAAPGLSPPEPRAVFTAFSSVLTDLSLRGPVVVAIDDLQWLDRPSQMAVEFVLRRLQSRSIGFLASVRLGPGSVLPPGLSRALEDAAAGRVRLGPLSVAALHALFVERLGESAPRPLLVRIAAASGGNPFFALEIGREIARRGWPSPGDALPVPDNLFELVSARIRRLPVPTREVLLAAAALRDPVIDLLDRAALDRAEAAGLVQVAGGRVVFTHPLFAAAVYGSASPDQRRRMHRQLASALTDPEERARHLARAAVGPSAEIATALDSAAELARSRGAPEGAAELLERAAQLTPEEEIGNRQHRTIAAAEHYLHAGDLIRARSIAERILAASPSGPARGNALRVLAEIRYNLDSFTGALQLLEEALAELGDDSRRIDVRVNLTFAHINHGSLKAAAEHGRAAVEDAREAGDQGLYAMALGASAIADYFAGGRLDRGRLELALALEEPDRQTSMSVRPSLVAAITLSLSDAYDQAGELLASLRKRTIERGEESDLPMVCAQLSYIERQRGRLAQALEYAEEGYEIGRTLGSDTAQALMLAERCFVRATLGDQEGARLDIKETDRLLSRVEYRLAQFRTRWALVFLEVSLGNGAKATTLLEPMVAAVEARRGFYPQAALALPDTIEALAAAGELDRAEALVWLLDAYGHEHKLHSALGAAARCRALVLAARGDLTGALAATDSALTCFERAQIPLDQGRTLLLGAQLERRAKRKAASQESLQRAIGLFEQVGARLWLERAQAELERTAARRPGTGELTPTERRVAELGGRGLTSKQIAKAVFLSPKTVEANLARIYQKLGIRSRAELGRVMAERDQTAEA